MEIVGPRPCREWLTQTPDGRAMHDRWFGCVQNHTVLRYVRGWDRIDPDEQAMPPGDGRSRPPHAR